MKSVNSNSVSSGSRKQPQASVNDAKTPSKTSEVAKTVQDTVTPKTSLVGHNGGNKSNSISAAMPTVESSKEPSKSQCTVQLTNVSRWWESIQRKKKNAEDTGAGTIRISVMNAL